MDKVYYKGLPYNYKVTEIGGRKMFSLYKDGVLIHFIEENSLDKKTIVSRLLDSYYKGPAVGEGSNFSM